MGLDRAIGWGKIPEQVLTRFQRRIFTPPAWINQQPRYMKYGHRVIIDRDSKYVISAVAC